MIRRRRAAFTMLELIAVTSLMGITIAAIAMLMRTSLTTWDAFENDATRIEAVHGAVRHMVRGLRQANVVTSVSGAAEPNGSIDVSLGTGPAARWHRSGGNVLYVQNGVSNTLCAVDALYFVGLKSDGTETTDVAQVRAVRITALVSLTGNGGGQRRIQCTAWLRVNRG